MKLHTQNYISPIETEGTYQDVYIEDVSYEIRRNDNLFKIKFEMYYIKNDKKIKLDEAEISFRGNDSDLVSGLPTTNRTAILSIVNTNYVPEHQGVNTDGNPILIPAIGEYYIDIPLIQYLQENNGQMPDQYTVKDWGFPTQEDAMQYFSGGELTSPELLVTNPFAKEWLKNTLQMKGEHITQFDFV